MSFSLARCIAFTSASLFAACCFGSCQLTESLGLTSTNWSLSSKAKREEQHALELEPHQKLSVDVASGDIQVQAVLGREPMLSATFTAYGSNEQEAKSSLEKTMLQVDQTEKGVRVSVLDDLVEHKSEEMTIRVRSRVDFVITVPPGTELDLDTDSGNIQASGTFGSCSLDSRYGEINVSDVEGDLSASSSSGDVEASNVRGERLEVKSGYGQIRISQAESKLIQVSTSSGDIRLENLIGGDIGVESGYGGIELRRVTGPLDVRSSSGALSADHILGERLRLRSGYGNIRVTHAQGELALHTSSGQVDVNDFKGALEARSGYGGLHARGEFNALDLSSSSGSVDAVAERGSKVTKDWQLRSGYGSIKLGVPADLECFIAARTGYGEVKLEIPVERESGPSQSERLVSGKMHGGGETIHADTSSGDIHIYANGN